jgi:hypothetical protein
MELPPNPPIPNLREVEPSTLTPRTKIYIYNRAGQEWRGPSEVTEINEIPRPNGRIIYSVRAGRAYGSDSCSFFEIVPELSIEEIAEATQNNGSLEPESQKFTNENISGGARAKLLSRRKSRKTKKSKKSKKSKKTGKRK